MVRMKLLLLSVVTTGFQCLVVKVPIGWEGQNNGAFQFPSWIAFDSLGNIVVPPAPPPQKKILYWQTAITTGCKSLIGMVTLLEGLVNLEVLITSLVTLKVYQ